MNNLNVKIEGEQKVLTVLTGNALSPEAPEKIELEGDITTVSNFLKVRKSEGSGLQTIDKSKAVVTVNKKERTISLELDPENKYGANVSGTLEESEELKQFSINKNKTFTKEELVKLFKFNKLFFADKDKHSGLVQAFQKISSTVNIKANDSSDERGNKERNYVKEVTTNAPTEFILEIPVFKGFGNKKFRVEVCLDVTDGSARFWLESIELHEIMQSEVDQIFNDQLSEAEGFVIVNK